MKASDSKTQENLMKAFLRESGAFNEYTFYAQQAKKEGYEEIYNVFTQFAMNEQAHAKIWFKLYHGISNTQENLKNSAQLENFERTVLYKDFASVAREEGHEDIANLFEGVAKIEHQHEQRFLCLLEQLKTDKYFSQPKSGEWLCLNCGHIAKGTNPPEQCPVCSHPQGYFKPLPKCE